MGVCLLDRFGEPGWRGLGEAYDRGELSFRTLIETENDQLRATRLEMLDFVLGHCPMDPTFAPFAEWIGSEGLPLTIVSDGSAFHIEPLLEAAGISVATIVTNEQVFGADGHRTGMRFPNGHPECVGCGTCKMQAVLRAQEAAGPVAFVGDGVSDRYAALYADVVFAKLRLTEYCERADVPYRPWDDFHDVRRSLESGDGLPGAVAPIRCPGWTTV